MILPQCPITDLHTVMSALTRVGHEDDGDHRHHAEDANEDVGAHKYPHRDTLQKKYNKQRLHAGPNFIKPVSTKSC